MRDINKILFGGFTPPLRFGSNIDLSRAGFTLIEVMIVVVILGVMAGLAVPVYTSTMEQSRGNEAQVDLNTIYLAEKIYKGNNGSYLAIASTNLAVAANLTAFNTSLNIDLATPQFYPTVAIVAGAGGIATSFTASATRVGGTWNGKVASINEAGTYTAPT